jgi:hypothetical protein
MPDYKAINEEIIKVWRAFPRERGDRIPLLFPPSEDGCALFISFNPSFPGTLNGRDWNHSYDIATLYVVNLEQVVQQEIETQNLLPYFKPLKVMAGKLQLPWAHLDIFMLRETSQKNAKPKVYESTSKRLTPFGQKQFDLFIKALRISTPKVIVVINALASEIIRTQIRLKYNSVDGCYYAPPGEKITAPFFLGSMLSGQRALDIYSRERLVWHIQQKLGTKGTLLKC